MAKSDNKKVNQLAKMAVVGEQHLNQQFQFEELHTPATDEEKSLSIKEGETWITLVYKFLMEDELPTDELLAKQVI